MTSTNSFDAEQLLAVQRVIVEGALPVYVDVDGRERNPTHYERLAGQILMDGLVVRTASEADPLYVNEEISDLTLDKLGIDYLTRVLKISPGGLTTVHSIYFDKRTSGYKRSRNLIGTLTTEDGKLESRRLTGTIGNIKYERKPATPKTKLTLYRNLHRLAAN